MKKKTKKKYKKIITWGVIKPSKRRILVLVICINFMLTGMIFSTFFKPDPEVEPSIVVPIKKNAKLEAEIRQMVAGYPIAQMTPYIAKQDPKTAMFLVAIAKKESAWGKRKPVLNGEDCYNYWGFRLKSDRMGSGGHTCFDSPEEAVTVVGARISHLINEEKIDTPKKMVVWKCGYGCDGPEAVGSEKWIKDVDYYYKKMLN